MQLADASFESGDYDQVVELLEGALKHDATEDKRGARRKLAPLYLRLGGHKELRSLLAKWPADGDAALSISALLLKLASWASGEGDESEESVQEAFENAHAANWHAVLLVCAWRTAAMKLPLNLVTEARTAGGGIGTDGAPPAGGIEEAYSLSSRSFGGWAGMPDADSDDEGEEGDDENEDEFPGLRGVSHWLGAMLLQHDPPENTDGLPGDGKKFVRHFKSEALAAALEEVQQRVVRMGDMESGEEGEEEERGGRGGGGGGR